MIIYLGPALMDWLLFLVLFAVLYGAGQRGLSMLECAWLGGLYQITYMLVSLLVGSLLTRQNARCILLVSAVLCTALGALSLCCTGFLMLLVALGLLGIMAAFFFNSFQTFMRGESPPGALSRTSGIYTLAWSLGAAGGFFSSGAVYRLGATALAALDVIVGLIILWSLAAYKPRPAQAPSSDDRVEQGQTNARPTDPRYLIVAWVMIFTVMFVQRPLQTYFPAISARAGIDSFAASIPLGLQMVLLGLIGFGMIPLRRVLYRRTPLLLVQAAAALLCLALWRWNSLALGLVGLSLLGIYYGFACFSAVYYASNYGRRSFNIGVNEFLIGLGSFAGLFVCQWWMQRGGSDDGMYLVCGLVLAFAAVLQLIAAGPRSGSVMRAASDGTFTAPSPCRPESGRRSANRR